MSTIAMAWLNTNIEVNSRIFQSRGMGFLRYKLELGLRAVKVNGGRGRSRSRWMGALTWKVGWWSWLDLGGWGRGWRQVAGAVMQYPAHWTDQPLDTCSDGRTSNGIKNLENLPEMPRNTSVWAGCKMFGILDKFKPGQPGLLVGRPRRLFWDQKDTDRCTVR